MPPRKRVVAEIGGNAAQANAPTKKSRSGKENSASDSNKADASASPSIAAMHEAACKLEYVTLPRPHYSLPREDSDDSEDELHDVQAIEAKKAEALKYNHKPIADFPDWPFIISKQAEKIFGDHHIAAAKCNQDIFSMHIYNDWTGYGLQEVIENQLSDFNKIMSVKGNQEPDAVELWIRLSAFAHWTQSEDLGPWMGQDDGKRWNDTGAMIGVAILATLNALQRSGLFSNDSPIKDLGLVIALLGSFLESCVEMTGDVPVMEGCDKMATWPWEAVRYAKNAGVEIKGVYDIEKEFVEKYGDEGKVGVWKTNEGVDRWGWKAKWKQFASAHGNRGKVGGHRYDITKMSAKERKKAHFDGKDPLDPKNPMVRFEE